MTTIAADDSGSLAAQFAADRYLLLSGLLSSDLAFVASRYAVMQSNMRFAPEDETGQVSGTHGVYGDHLMESLLDCLTPRLENLVGLKLWPTYSYYRVYRPGDQLKRHKDRASCEVSATVCLGFRDGSRADQAKTGWPMFLDPTGGEGNPGRALPSAPGDAIIYQGCALEHWREPWDAPKGSWHAQAFLHYVQKDGPFGELCRYDARPAVGFPNSLMNKESMRKAEALRKQLYGDLRSGE